MTKATLSLRTQWEFKQEKQNTEEEKKYDDYNGHMEKKDKKEKKKNDFIDEHLKKAKRKKMS